MLSMNADIGTFANEHKSGPELCFQLREKVRLHSGDHRDCREVKVHDRHTAEEICDAGQVAHRVRQFNENNDADIKGAISGLKHMNTVGFHLLRILPDNVIMDVRRSPDVKLGTYCYETLRNMVN